MGMAIILYYNVQQILDGFANLKSYTYKISTGLKAFERYPMCVRWDSLCEKDQLWGNVPLKSCK